MSRIYFHSLWGDAEVCGPERFLFSRYCTDAMLGALGLNSRIPFPERTASLSRLIRTKSGPRNFSRDPHGLATFLSVAYDASFDLGELGSAGVFDVALNTLLATGNDAMMLAARIHGQCEIHCWVEGPNRAWLASIIEAGRTAGIYRSDMGWESVIELLRSRDDEPVVLSYSVCDSFPNAGIARLGGWERPAGDEDDDSWYDVDVEEQWRLAMAGLRARPTLELRPDRWAWGSYWLGKKPLTAFHVNDAAAAPEGESGQKSEAT